MGSLADRIGTSKVSGTERWAGKSVNLTRQQALAIAALIKRVDDVNTARVSSMSGGYGDIVVDLWAPSQRLSMRVYSGGSCEEIYPTS